MRILLAGGAGTLGTDIVENLYNEHEFLVIDDFKESAECEEWFAGKSKVIKCNLSGVEAYAQEVIDWQPNCIIYLATTVSQDAKRGYASVEGIKNLIDLEYSSELLPRFLYIQSFLTRDCSAPIAPDSQIQARDQYATWKIAGEFLLREYLGEHSTVVLASVISPRLTVGAIPAFARRIRNHQPISVTLSNRDYLHPLDFISALKSLYCLPAIPSLLTIGHDESLSTTTLAQLVGLNLGKTFEIGEIEEMLPASSDPTTVRFDSSVFRDWSGWTQEHSVESAIKGFLSFQANNNPDLRSHH